MTSESEPFSQARWSQVPPSAATPEDAKGEVFNLPGLDLEEAARLLDNDWAMLRRVLISFHQGFAGAPAQLADALGQGDWDFARRLVHTIKGLTLTIGARGLHPLAMRFEAHLARQETTLLAEFQAALSQVLAAVAQLPGGVNAGNPVPASPGGTETTGQRQDLVEVAAWLQRHRQVPATLLQRLGGDWGSPEANGLRDALLAQIGQFDYVRALDTLIQLQEQFTA